MVANRNNVAQLTFSDKLLNFFHNEQRILAIHLEHVAHANLIRQTHKVSPYASHSPYRERKLPTVIILCRGKCTNRALQLVDNSVLRTSLLE